MPQGDPLGYLFPRGSENYPQVDMARNKQAPLAKMGLPDIIQMIGKLFGGMDTGPAKTYMRNQNAPLAQLGGGEEQLIQPTGRQGIDAPAGMGNEEAILASMGLGGGSGAIEGDVIDIDRGGQRHMGKEADDMEGLVTPVTTPEDDGSMEAGFEAMAADGMESGQYTIVEGDTLWDIAERVYGNGQMYTTIARANGIKNPDKLAIGQTINIPEIPMPRLRRQSMGEV